MQLAQFLDRQAKVLLTRLSGPFGQDDLPALYASVQRVVEREGPTLRSVQDFGGITSVDLDLGRVAQHGWRKQILPGRQRIMVVPQPEFQKIARMFAAYQKFAEFDEPAIVGTLDEAYALLGLADLKLEPLA